MIIIYSENFKSKIGRLSTEVKKQLKNKLEIMIENPNMVKLLPKAYRDIDQIYSYILEEFKVPKTAKGMVESIEDTILGLEEFPYRGSERKVGVYANRGYRQLFIKNSTIVYRIDKKMKYVIIVTVKYS